MPRKHTVVVALSLAFAAVAGTIALTKTVHLGQASAAKSVSKAVISKRSKQLNRFEASLRAALKRTPPAVPKLPAVPAVSTTPAVPAPAVSAAPSSAPAPAGSQRVVYVRPAPIIVHKHRAGGESEGSDHGDGGGSAASGGGLDD